MGYYSDVGLCLTKNGIEKLATALADMDNSEKLAQRDKDEIHDLLCLPPQKADESGAGAWFWETVKWYDGYTDVDFVDNFLTGLDEEDYYFIIVGEDYDDTEIRGLFWDNPFTMHLVRSICFE